MKLILLLSISFVFGITSASAQTVGDMSWLSGCWQFTEKDSGNIVTEQWMKPLGGMMMGMSRTVNKSGKTSQFEFVRLIGNDKGIFYSVRPGMAKEETPFKLVKSAVNSAEFENKENDFPNKIVYQLKNKNSLFAYIEGVMDGKPLKIDYPYKRIKCE